MPSEYELARARNIARNRALLEELDLKNAIPVKPDKSTAKPVQPRKPRERAAPDGPRRQSARLKSSVIDPNETPAKRKRREAEWEERRAQEEEERLEAEEKARAAKRARHGDLGLATLVQEGEVAELPKLAELFESIPSLARQAPKDEDAYRSEDEEEDKMVAGLREQLGSLQVVARAKVTAQRVYSAVYHPEVTKDLIFFGDKYGSLGIWDARAPQDEVEDEDGDVSATGNLSEGKYWQLQLHWPATSKSSISCVKLDPTDSHKIYTSAYDCTIRQMSLPSGVSTEVFGTEDVLICSIDLTPTGNEMWISDAHGGVWHRDLREPKADGTRYALSDAKIGCVSVNPTRPNFLVTASNNLDRIWDVRKLQNVLHDDTPPTPPPSSPGGPFLTPISRVNGEADAETVAEYVKSKRGQGTLRAEWTHDKSVSSAYWDPRGRHVVSTSYDDAVRLWDISPNLMESASKFPTSRPFSRIQHNCQTGKWLTILRAQWSPNPDAYPHFTIGNMDHSLDIFSCKGELVAKLKDKTKISAVQAVTCSHPSIVERAVSGNGSGRCVLWAPREDDEDEEEE
ncbi:DNA damage-binding protein CMR1 [Mycena chlorophos]|uniref:DNA damage-binding protein CMR1 n=1 Tax=Mycena chlorophos TaxID=658473 RepID=A0A8H6TPZ1_MYCCL|nr:DNA damage-binding protein CMR1 [Mycena chlorophos]